MKALALTCLVALTACSGFDVSKLAQGSNGTLSTSPEWEAAKSTFARNQCNSCHGTQPGMGGVYLFDQQALLDQGYIVAGDPDSSLVYMNTNGTHQSVPALSNVDRATIAAWIRALPSAVPTPTPAPTATPLPTPPPTSTPPQTNAEFYDAKIGPNGLSVNDLLANNGRCANCHSTSGATPDNAAMSYLILNLGDASGNYSRLGAVNYPGGVHRDIRSVAAAGGLSMSLYNFAAGHKPKTPVFSQADLAHIMNFVNTR